MASPEAPDLRTLAFAHVTGFGKFPAVATLEKQGWVRVAGAEHGGMWVMRRAGMD